MPRRDIQNFCYLQRCMGFMHSAAAVPRRRDCESVFSCTSSEISSVNVFHSTYYTLKNVYTHIVNELSMYSNENLVHGLITLFNRTLR